MDTEIHKLSTILQGLLDGTIVVSEAETEIRSLRLAGLENLHGHLFHYLADDDIRGKDPRYKEMQDSEMKKVICHLKAGNLAKANGISFLRRT